MDDDVPSDEDRWLVDYDMDADFREDDSHISSMTPDVEEEYY